MTPWCWWCHSNKVIPASDRTPFAWCGNCGRWAEPDRSEQEAFDEAHTYRGGLGSDKYKAYIQSDAWKRRRTRKLKEAGYKCERCGAKDVPLHVHHKTYWRLYRERMDDLQVTCAPCHKLADEERRANWAD